MRTWLRFGLAGLLTICLAACSDEVDPPDAGVDGPTVDGPTVDGPSVDGPTVDGPSVDGPSVDGPNGDGPSAEGPMGDGPMGDGPMGDGPAGDAKAADAYVPVGQGTCPTSPPATLRFCLSFTKVAGTKVTDESSQGHVGTLGTVGTSIIDGGKFGDALSLKGLPGQGAAFGVAILELTGAKTIELWFRQTGVPKQWDTLIHNWGSTGYWLGGSNPVGGIEFWTDGTYAKAPGLGLGPNTGWHHIAATFNSLNGVHAIYLDGKLRGGTAAGGSGPHGAAPLIPFRIGAGTVAHGLPIKADIDEVKVWAIIKTPKEICASAEGTWNTAKKTCN
jgi:hypothetical protein